jgi:hypothetical protein
VNVADGDTRAAIRAVLVALIRKQAMDMEKCRFLMLSCGVPEEDFPEQGFQGILELAGRVNPDDLITAFARYRVAEVALPPVVQDGHIGREVQQEDETRSPESSLTTSVAGAVSLIPENVISGHEARVGPIVPIDAFFLGSEDDGTATTQSSQTMSRATTRVAGVDDVVSLIPENVISGHEDPIDPIDAFIFGLDSDGTAPTQSTSGTHSLQVVFGL